LDQFLAFLLHRHAHEKSEIHSNISSLESFANYLDQNDSSGYFSLVFLSPSHYIWLPEYSTNVRCYELKMSWANLFNAIRFLKISFCKQFKSVIQTSRKYYRHSLRVKVTHSKQNLSICL